VLAQELQPPGLLGDEGLDVGDLVGHHEVDGEEVLDVLPVVDQRLVVEDGVSIPIGLAILHQPLGLGALDDDGVPAVGPLGDLPLPLELGGVEHEHRPASDQFRSA
jgi:hypothetical protein